MIHSGTASTEQSNCPTAMWAQYVYRLTDTSSTNYCYFNSFLDICTSTSAPNINTTLCSTTTLYSSESGVDSGLGGWGWRQAGGGPLGEGEGLMMLVVVVVVVLTVAYTPAPAPYVPPSTPSSALPPRSTPVDSGLGGWGVETSRGRAFGGR